jgi:hypothetical protein
MDTRCLVVVVVQHDAYGIECSQHSDLRYLRECTAAEVSELNSVNTL